MDFRDSRGVVMVTRCLDKDGEVEDARFCSASIQHKPPSSTGMNLLVESYALSHPYHIRPFMASWNVSHAYRIDVIPPSLVGPSCPIILEVVETQWLLLECKSCIDFNDWLRMSDQWECYYLDVYYEDRSNVNQDKWTKSFRALIKISVSLTCLNWLWGIDTKKHLIFLKTFLENYSSSTTETAFAISGHFWVF